jgi:hypothetical protein
MNALYMAVKRYSLSITLAILFVSLALALAGLMVQPVNAASRLPEAECEECDLISIVVECDECNFPSPDLRIDYYECWDRCSSAHWYQTYEYCVYSVYCH